MKKAILAALILSLLLATLTACGAEAQQPTTPEPAPKIEQSEPVAKPEPLAASEKTEISQEELEPIFEKVFTEVSENHPEDWSVDFQITDEIGKITKAIPEDKKAPANLREIYIEWRAAKTEPDTTEPEPEPIPEPEPEPVPQQPTTSQGSSDTQNDTSGVKHTPGGDGTSYADANGGSNGKTFNSDDLYVDTDPNDIIGTIIFGGSDSTEQTEPEAQSDQSSTSTTYPAGTTTKFGNTTYTSTGELVNGGKWVKCTASDGSAIIVNIKSGTITPLITGAGADVDLGDGGQAMADAGGMGHADFGDQEHNFNGES